MSVVKFDICGSNYDVEKIIQSYIDDLNDMDKHKQKYSLVMNQLDLAMHKKPRCGLITYAFQYDFMCIAVFICKRCKFPFANCSYTNSKRWKGKCTACTSKQT